MPYRNKIIIIFCCAILLRLIFSIGLFATDQPLFSLKGDAESYIQTAKNFIEKGVWSANPGDNPRPDNVRTPVYPLFLMFFLGFGIPLVYAAIIQDILMAISAVLIYVLGRRLFSEKVAFFAGLVFALEPYLASTFVSRAIMTEVFAVFLLILSFLNLALYIKEKNNKNLIAGSVFLALSALTKPQFFLFFIFIFIAVILAGKMRLKPLFFACAVFLLLISPWLFYNFFILKTIQFSSVPGLSLYVAADFFQQWENKDDYLKVYEYPIEKAKRMLGVSAEELFEPENAKKLSNIGKEIIVARPFSFAYYQIIHIPRLFWHETTIETIAQDFNISQNAKQGEMDINVIKNVLHGRFNDAFKNLSNHPIWIVSLFLKIAVLLLGLLALLNFFLRWILGKEISRVSLFLLLIIVLYAVMMSPFGQQRYRVPIEPFILILAFDSIGLIFYYLRGWIRDFRANIPCSQRLG